MSLWKKISFGLLAFIILLLMTAALLLGTTPGLHLLFKAADRWVPGLSIDQVSGGWKDLSVKNLRYAQPGVAVDAGQLHLAINAQCLWRSRLCVNDISLSHVNVTIDSKKMPPSAPAEEDESGPLNLSTPYPITLSRVALNDVTVKIDDTRLAVINFTSGLSWQEKNLTLTPTLLQGLLVALPKVARVAQEQVIEPKISKPKPAEKPLGETLKDLFSKPVLPAMTDVHLPFNLTIQEFRGEQLRLTGDTDLTVYRLRLKASSSDDNLTLDALDVDSSQGTLNASGTAKLQDGWPVDLTVNGTLNSDPLEGEKIVMKVGGEVRKRLDVGIALSGPLDADIRAQAQLAEAGLPLKIELLSKQLRWPFSGEKRLQADDLQLKLSGKMTDYTLSLRTALKGQGVPPATITLDAKGNEQQVNLDKLTIAALEGKTELKALLDWRQAISWRGELTLNDINTAKELPEWPAKLSGVIKTSGSLYGGSWQMDIPQLKLSGNVRQNRVDVDGKLSGNSYLQWQIPGLHLALGRNSVEVKGELGVKDLNLDASIDAPGLDNALPGLGGTAKGLLKVRGTVDAPQLLADISAHHLRWQEISVAQASIKGNVKSTDRIGGNLDVRVNSITQPGVKISLLQLSAQGDEQQHKLALRLQGEPLSGQLSLAGSFDRKEQRWKGVLSNTRLQTPVGPWSLSRAIALDYRNKEQKISIGPHCWANPNAELCVPQAIDAGVAGRAVVSLNRFDLAMLKPFMPEATQASGVFSGNADVSWDAAKEGLPQGKVTLSGRNVKVIQTVNDAPLPVEFETLNLNADVHDNRAQLGWMIRLANNGQLDGQIEVSDPRGRRNLGGSVNIRNVSLAMINPIFSRGEKAAGSLNARLRLGGNVQSPQLFGRMQLSGVDIDGNFMPFAMQPSRVAMNFNGTRSTLDGVIATRQGQISLSGNADWTRLDNWRAQVAAKGSRVRITVPPMVRLDLSPDVVFTATPSLFTLDGNVDVPWARIVVHDVPESAVGVSSDEVMLDKDLKPVASQSGGIPINSNLTVRVGSNVRLDAFGLKARLTGNLQVVQDKQGLGLSGQITIPEGRFRAYGQNLIVRKGILLFSGPPDRPLLNIEAIRNPDATEDNVTAGVRVTGIASQPKAEIFSEPGMSQQIALSYLLRGQGLGSGRGDGSAMTSALIGLGVAQSGQIVGKIGEAFGVSNLAFDTAGAGSASKVVVSGYITPGLQVKYGVGIFDSLATLTLRYRLMPKLYLEAVSGIGQALDLLYQFEF